MKLIKPRITNKFLTVFGQLHNENEFKLKQFSKTTKDLFQSVQNFGNRGEILFKMSDYILRGKPEESGLPRISVGKIIFNKLKEFGNRVCLVDAGTEEELTYADVLYKSTKLADALKRLGLKENDVISQITENNINYVVPFFASLYYGFRSNFVNPANTNYELSYYLGITKPKCVFCSKSVLPKIFEILSANSFIEYIVVTDAPAGEGYYSMEQLIQEEPENPNFQPKDFDPEEQIALILYSSGTTGMPKAVALSHKNLRFSFVQTGPNYHGSTEKDVVVFALPLYHVASTMVLGSCFVYGAKSIFLSKFQPELFLSAIEKYKCTYTMFVPTIVNFLIHSPLVKKYDLTSLKRIIIGSSPSSSNAFNDLAKIIPTTFFYNLYGLTEGSCGVTICPLDKNNINSVGMITANCEAKFVDLDSRKPVGVNTIGELCLRGDCAFKCYYNNEKATNQAFDNEGFFKTGDVGYFDEDNHVHIVDRVKDMIKYKSFQVSSVELETVLKLHKAVKEAAVIGIPDDRAGELPLAFIVKEEEAQVGEEELQLFVAKHLNANKHLHGGVLFVEEMPRKTLLKVDKNKLREYWSEIRGN